MWQRNALLSPYGIDRHVSYLRALPFCATLTFNSLIISFSCSWPLSNLVLADKRQFDNTTRNQRAHGSELAKTNPRITLPRDRDGVSYDLFCQPGIQSYDFSPPGNNRTRRIIRSVLNGRQGDAKFSDISENTFRDSLIATIYLYLHWAPSDQS